MLAIIKSKFTFFKVIFKHFFIHSFKFYQSNFRSSKLLSVNSHLSYQIHPYQSIQKLIITQRQVSLRTLPFI
ncbi:hypothetical protein [uncultured Gammaproteobacteria bacterium]|nr:hypothetical protein [uncultured Gammaproteobacteria bacterium]